VRMLSDVRLSRVLPRINLSGLESSEAEYINVEEFFFIMYFGLQDTKPPPCPLHLTKQGGSIHC
jgi:hypothetical protein